MDVLRTVDDLNCDPKVHGIIVQMPLESDNTIDSGLVTDRVDPEKDVDGLTTVNEGRLSTGDMTVRN